MRPIYLNSEFNILLKVELFAVKHNKGKEKNIGIKYFWDDLQGSDMFFFSISIKKVNMISMITYTKPLFELKMKG